VDISDGTHCSFTRPDGTRCAGRVRPPATMCFMHDPEKATERHEARRQGGRERSKPAAVLPEGAPDFPLETMADVRTMVAAVVNLTLKGKVDPKVSNAVGYLVGALVRSIEGDVLTKRIEALEARMTARHRHEPARQGQAP